jgi:toxin ParE1/3/4
MPYQITEPAARDIQEILRTTLKEFGTRQLGIYAGIIEKATQMAGTQPDCPGSIERSELAPGVRLLHLAHAANRRGAAAHCLYFATGSLSNGEAGAIILRVLHEAMEPRHRVVRSLAAFSESLPP